MESTTGSYDFFRYIGVSGSATLTPGRNLRKSWNLASQLRSSEQCKKKQRRRLVPSRLFTPFPIRMTSFFILSEKVAELVANNRESCGKLPSPTKVA